MDWGFKGRGSGVGKTWGRRSPLRMPFRHKRKTKSVRQPVMPAESCADKVLKCESQRKQIGFESPAEGHKEQEQVLKTHL